MGHDYSYSHPSESSATWAVRNETPFSLSSASTRRHRSPRNSEFVVPRNCDCGGGVTLGSNPSYFNGRLFYKCENHDSGGVHTLKSWDKHVLDVLDDIIKTNLSLEKRVNSLSRGPRGEKIEPSGMWSQLNYQGNYIKELEENLQGVFIELKDDIKQISAMISKTRSGGSKPKTMSRNHILGFAIGFLVLVCLFAVLKLV